jgi:hypothetical protein
MANIDEFLEGKKHVATTTAREGITQREGTARRAWR